MAAGSVSIEPPGGVSVEVKVASPEAYQLLHDGTIALAQVEHNGIRIDVDYLTATIDRLRSDIKKKEYRFRDTAEYAVWKRRFKDKTNLQSRSQLGWLLFDHMGYRSSARTTSGRMKLDDTVLQSIDHPIAKQFRELEKLRKATNTFLAGILRETDNGFLRAFYNLNIARTFRSSSDSPNFQNLPIRDKEIGKLIRTCFIPRDPSRRLVEIDFSGIEVGIAACYHRDPAMMKYLKDKTKDMHRDMASQCYRLDQKLVTKAIRHAGKNKFVFPQFYGDYYINCAQSMWEAADTPECKLADGRTLKQHLIDSGIPRLGKCDPESRPVKGTFEHHIKEVENDFWQNRFAVYGKWKQSWYSEYVKQGGFHTLTGFAISGVMRKNDVINYPVQGSAFHCLLWSLVRLQAEIRKRGMKALIVGQIHDSIVADVPDSEIEDFVALAHDIMTKQLPRAWKWIVVPLEVEVEVTPLGGSWFDKKAWTFT